jgi:hypothetical protein
MRMKRHAILRESIDSPMVFYGAYEARVGNGRVIVFPSYDRDAPNRKSWRVRVYYGPKTYYSNGNRMRTLKSGKEEAARVWIRMQLNDIRDILRGEADADFYALYSACWAMQPGAPGALHDWLCDHGRPEMLPNRIVRPGNKAGIFWPAGWGDLAKELVR